MSSENASTDSSSSLYSLLKSSDEYMNTENSNNSTGEAESIPPRPVLQDPFWLQNVDVTPELIYGYRVSLVSDKNISSPSRTVGSKIIES